MDRQAAASARNRLEALRKEIASTESEMKQLQDSMDTLIRMQERLERKLLPYKTKTFSEEKEIKTLWNGKLCCLEGKRTNDTFDQNAVDGLVEELV